MRVRLAHLDDATRIAEIHVTCWRVGYQSLIPEPILNRLSVPMCRDFSYARIRLGKTTVLVASASDRVCGWLAYDKCRDEDATSTVKEVYGFYVDPASWRTGAGTFLWQEAKQRLAQSKTEFVTLWVLEANTPARRFYESIGWQLDVGHIKPFEKDGTVLPQVRYRTTVR